MIDTAITGFVKGKLNVAKKKTVYIAKRRGTGAI
jgi:hypothetical protein